MVGGYPVISLMAIPVVKILLMYHLDPAHLGLLGLQGLPALLAITLKPAQLTSRTENRDQLKYTSNVIAISQALVLKEQIKWALFIRGHTLFLFCFDTF